MIEKIIFLFPLWMILSSVIAYFFPSAISWFKGSYITTALGFIMLGMGLTMKIDDFRPVFKNPKSVFIGVFLQYTVMPISGYLIGKFFQLETSLAVGLILVAACPGGTASNVLAYIAKADVALSVTLTTISTFLGIFLTPMLTLFFAGEYIKVNALGIFIDTIQVIILPILLGVILNHFFPKFSFKISKASPILAIIMIILIVTSVITANQKQIIQSGTKLLLSVFLLHSIGFFLGYIISFMITKNILFSRTVSIEVGMQNSGLGVVLAKNNFVDPMIAVPAAISSFAHSMIASLLAWFWRR